MKQQIEVDLKWYCFSQNNSGGRFVHDDNVDEYVLIQDTSAARAVARAEQFCDNTDSCPCCGDRWSFWLSDDDGNDEPTIYSTPIWKMQPSHFRNAAKLHYFDGTVKTYKFGNPPISNLTA